MQIFGREMRQAVRRQICTKFGEINANRNVTVLLLR